jgi:16S rRNA (guanine(966)-N(2))-methyltransferase RsmD
MRVVAGKYRSRVLKSLRGSHSNALRPTSDSLRETLFNILGPTVEGSIFVDVYAGTGAVGIEALSRGAREVIFIEEHLPAVTLIRKNLQSLEIETGVVRLGLPRVEILAMDAVRGLEMLASRRVHAHFFFLDPPYAEKEEYERTLDFLDSSPMLTPGGWVIVEHDKRRALPESLAELERARVVEQGDAALSFYRLALAA